MNFCEDCNKIVPDNEVKTLLSFKKHIYRETKNAYRNEGTMRVGFMPISNIVYCGKVREPTPEEYFIYHSLKFK